jgi:hypothetical protein
MVVLEVIPLISKILALVRDEEGAIDPAPLKARVPPSIFVGPVYVLAAAKVNVPAPVFTIELPVVPVNTPDAVPSEPWIIVNDFDPRDTTPVPL